ncbi:MAG: hypothetical protein L6Q37_16195, partial [Bdellovibrionaceae bacterium]|nr:hypothetical protein [Pseudobdellovibrionaceae bacterium]
VSYLAQKKPPELNRKINSSNSYSNKWLKYQECLLDNQEENLQNENDYRRALTDTLLIGGSLMTGVAAPLSSVVLEARQVAFLKNILSAEKYINSANLLNGVKQSIEECSKKIQTIKLSSHENSELKCEYKDLYFSAKMTNLFDSCLSQTALSFLDATPLAINKFQRALQTRNLTLTELKELERLESSDEYLYKLWPEEHRHQHLAIQGVSKTSAEKIAFTRSFQNYNPTSVNQNKKYMQLAENAFDQIYTTNSKFKALVVENSVLKPLNALYNDRDFVTSLTNLHKSILMKQMTPFIEKWRKKGLSIATYSDFKSMKFLMRGDFPPEAEKELASLYQQTNKDYADYLIKNKIVRKEDHPEDWFRGGLGNSDEQASSQAKMARDSSENSLENFNNPTTLKKINTTVDNMNELLNHETNGIGRYFEKIGISKKDENIPGIWSFDKEAIDILRKSESTTQAQMELAHRFNSNNISIDAVERLKKYFDEVNKLPASLLIPERKFASFSPTTKGGISFDMIGMGSVNLEETSLAVQKAFSKPLPTTNIEIEKANRALYQSRQAEKKATDEFIKRQQKITEIVTSTLGKDRVSVICSGDDCIVNLTSALTLKEKNKLAQNIANSDLGNQFRMSFASEKIIDTSSMTQLTNEGESIAKAIKKLLSLELEPRKISGLSISIDMETPTLGGGPIRLIYAMNNSAILSPAEKQKIEQAYKMAVKKHNINLKKENYPGYDAF